jgi:hypothetical protein
MHTQHPAVHQRRQREIIKNFRAIPPSVCISILSLAFVVEPVHLGDLARLVVASEQSNVGGKAGFQQHEKGEDFQGVVPAVYKIAHEDVVGLRDGTSCVKELQEVMKLAMDVAADLFMGLFIHYYWGYWSVSDGKMGAEASRGGVVAMCGNVCDKGSLVCLTMYQGARILFSISVCCWCFSGR